MAEERFEVASERYKLESILKLDVGGTGEDLIQARVEVKENFKELEKKEKELEKRSEHLKETEKRLVEEKRQLQERDDEIKIKSIRVEKVFKVKKIIYFFFFVSLTVMFNTSAAIAVC